MISSAVVVPDDVPLPLSPASTKRRPSESTSSSSSKRPRLSDSSFSNPQTNHNSHHGDIPSPTSSRRKPSALGGKGAIEEKKRGQRLFGALLGTLSQSSATGAQRRRAEVDKRHAVRDAKRGEEVAEEEKKRRETLTRKRGREQELWDERCMRLRHQNLRAEARFLRTATKPRLFYKPWDIRPDEEARVKEQIDGAENIIREEIDAHQAKQRARTEEAKTKDTEAAESSQRSAASPSAPQAEEHQKIPNGIHDHTPNVEADSKKLNTPPPEEKANIVELLPKSDSPAPEAPLVVQPTPEQKENLKVNEKVEEKQIDDHSGEELVEGQEDDVIY